MDLRNVCIQIFEIFFLLNAINIKNTEITPTYLNTNFYFLLIKKIVVLIFRLICLNHNIALNFDLLTCQQQNLNRFIYDLIKATD